ncbi:FAD-dependent oxidoreductase [Microbacterium sp. NEAU-LLC]|uniref:FAD-dependent oxidoreductase n=1 Tax=Microbacterium helvum TaxID=2773713 RepID=A0ABR8NNR8_9MICO|nr:FAD-dependent oxidoreductase [Microbacterium helvum]MBD3942092.1 FAD-dependent oxidoreductase [Microbacterium helvum]
MSSGIQVADVLIVGGGLGGIAAAQSAVALGRTAVITTEGPWLGGQLTTQAVPPDENQWIETLASTTYARLRATIRGIYAEQYPVSPYGRRQRPFNPGLGNVSRITHEPRVAAVAIESVLSPSYATGRLTVLRHRTPIAVEREGRRIRSVTVRDTRTGNELTIDAHVVIDATELGDLLELAALEFVTGAEAQHETGELHALEVADPLDQQAVSWCFAIEHRPGEDHVIDRPASYAHWRDTHDPRWPAPQLSWEDLEPPTLARRHRAIFSGDPADAVAPDGRDFWHYRRVLGAANFDGSIPDVTLVNWPQIDYWEQPLVGPGIGPAERAAAAVGARGLSESLLYWMQTEARRPDGGTGYPGLRLRPDVVGSEDGFALEPYIREARRIRAVFTVTEEHIGCEMRDGRPVEQFADSVGIGSYRIDLHPSTAGRTYVDIDCDPFQIPLGALIPRDADNLIPANKNIGTTHISNGAYRLHPVEWGIGEAAGVLAATMLATGESAEGVRARHLEDVQRTMLQRGVPIAWPRRVLDEHALFLSAQR